MRKWKANIPESEGTYILVMEVASDFNIKIGCLGKHELKEGIYMYVGSARGPGGLKARIYRHLRLNKRIRWHIDYLTVNPKVKIKAVFYLKSKTLLETIVARRLLSSNFFEGVIKGFGCTDRKNSYTHLYKLKNINSIEELMKELMRIVGDIRRGEQGFIIINDTTLV
ncbi:MAG: GIY-YIG nuclease family protein [Candidatus Methanomethylicia archaeon]